MSDEMSVPKVGQWSRSRAKDMLAGLSQAGISLFVASLVPPFEVTNVVVTFNLQVSWINLHALSLQFDHIKYNPRKFAAAVFWLKEPRTSTLVFCTGNTICAGGRSMSAAMLSARKVCNSFYKKKVWSFLGDFSVCNVVGAMWCMFSINLKAMYSANMVDATIKCTYNLQSFLGLVMRLAQPKAVFLVFQSGKVVCTGGKSEEDIKCIEAVWFSLLRYKVIYFYLLSPSVH